MGRVRPVGSGSKLVSLLERLSAGGETHTERLELPPLPPPPPPLWLSRLAGDSGAGDRRRSDRYTLLRISLKIRTSEKMRHLVMLRCFQIPSGTNSLLVQCVALYLADRDGEGREDEDGQGHPGHVCFEAPGLGEVAPTIEDPWGNF